MDVNSDTSQPNLNSPNLQQPGNLDFSQPSQPSVSGTRNTQNSSPLKTAITIIMLFVFFPVGIILMFLWMKWPTWVKVLVLFLIPIVLGIVAILGALVLVMINPEQQMKLARDVERVQDIKDIQSGLSQYYSATNSYPVSLVELVPNYLTEIPMDPLDNQYSYELTDNGQGYSLCLTYEAGEDAGILKCTEPSKPSYKAPLTTDNAQLSLKEEIQSDLTSLPFDFSYNVYYGENTPPIEIGDNIIGSYIAIQVIGKEEITASNISEVGKQVCTTLQRLKKEVNQVQVETSVLGKDQESLVSGIGGTCIEWQEGEVYEALTSRSQPL